MQMRFRLLRIFLAALFRRRNLYFTGQSVLHFTVMPWDCVVKRVGNDRYHAFMDLGRFDLLMRLGGLNTLISKNLQPFVFTVHARYCRPLKLPQPFVVKTRFIHADKNFFLLEHIFKSGKKIMATAVSKNGFTSYGKIVPTNVFFAALNAQNVRTVYTHGNISIINDIEGLLKRLVRKKPPI